MAYHNNPRIVTDGIAFCLDANSKRSYPGSGTTWYDLCGNLDVTANGVTMSSSGMVFDGTDDYINESWPSALNIDDNTTGRTWEVWVKPDAVGSTYGIFGHKAGVGCSYYCNGGIFLSSGYYRANWYDNSSYQWLAFSSGATTSAAHVVVTVSSDSKMRIYVNGVLGATSSASNFNYSGGMGVVDIGYNSKSGGQHYFDGTIYSCKFYYGVALSLAQIQQNYNAHKSRFGL